MRPLNRVISFDRERGLVEVEAGIEWPELVDTLVRAQEGASRQWGIAQKQTGADRLTIGGAMAANVHGRGLTMPPFVADIEDFTIVGADGNVKRCSRTENRDLFSLAVGGYGLFGVVTSLTMRLAPRVRVERVVELRTIDGLIDAMQHRIADGFLYGDFQFDIDSRSPEFMRRGVFSCYRPVGASVSESPAQRELGDEDWVTLLRLAHFDKAKAWEIYSTYYMSTQGQVYWSDTHQLSVYIDDYHKALDTQSGTKATEIITEIYVPRARLADFMEEAAADFIKNKVDNVYGTVRLIERDRDSFLAWAKQPYACVIFNLHTEHTEAGRQHSADAFRRLIDMAIARGGSYYLTYHRFARPDQVEACYPRFAEFLREKKRRDPDERFQSDWYRHYRTMFGV
jgi:FAD/FMN-containing dehydrogenase